LFAHGVTGTMGRPKRNILAAAEESTTPPDGLTSTQSLARVAQAEGNNLYTCELPGAGGEPTKILVELASRFRNTIWIRRGGYVLVDLTSNKSRKSGSRVDGDIINVVRDEKTWRKQRYWPAEFAKQDTDDGGEDDSNVGKLPPTDSDGD